MHTHMHAQSCPTLWDPMSMGFFRWEYWSGLPFPSPGTLPSPGLEPESPASPALAGGFFTAEPTGEALFHTTCLKIPLGIRGLIIPGWVKRKNYGDSFPREAVVSGREKHAHPDSRGGGSKSHLWPHPSDVQPWSGDGAWISVTGTSSQGRDVRQSYSRHSCSHFRAAPRCLRTSDPWGLWMWPGRGESLHMGVFFPSMWVVLCS